MSVNIKPIDFQAIQFMGDELAAKRAPANVRKWAKKLTTNKISI